MIFSKEQKKILLICLVILFFGTFVTLYQQYFKKLPKDELQVDKAVETPTSNIFIHDNPKAKVLLHLGGAVLNPGIYEVASNLRIKDVLANAGGTLPNADLDKINLAAKVKDGQKVFVPFKKQAELKKRSATYVKPTKSSAKLDLNTATKQQLVDLPVIGDKIAQDIIDYREKLTREMVVTDLLKIKSIKYKKYQKIKGFFTNAQ